jgi:hypothetical protein
MKDAKSLLPDVLAAILDTEKLAALFAEDGTVEMPFLYSVGSEPPYERACHHRRLLRFGQTTLPRFRFQA